MTEAPEKHFEGDDSNLTDPPEEGDDQAAKEGTKVPKEGELNEQKYEDAPEDSEGDAA